MVKIVGIAGSLRPDATSYLALTLAIQRVQALGASTEILDLRQMQLPFCTGGNDYPGYPDVMRLRETVQEADALILASPEYHGSISGVLKNALDLMGFDQFGGKMIGVIGVSGGTVGAINALNSLRTIGRSLQWLLQ